MVRDCEHCVFATRVRNGTPGELICASVPGHEGELSQVAAGQVCRGFRARPKPPVRREPPEPPNDDVRYIPLTRGLFAIVDKQDYEWLSGFKWHATSGRKSYASFVRQDKAIYMHRLIMNPPEGCFVDHIDGNSLNNRRSNLRICTKAENAWNRPAFGGTSRFKGVHRDRHGKWKAGIRVGGRCIFIGLFDDEVEAARAYDRMARKLFGDFAYLNFPPTGRVVWLAGRIYVRSQAHGRMGVRVTNHRQPIRPVESLSSSLSLRAEGKVERQAHESASPVSFALWYGLRPSPSPTDLTRACREPLGRTTSSVEPKLPPDTTAQSTGFEISNLGSQISNLRSSPHGLESAGPGP